MRIGISDMTSRSRDYYLSAATWLSATEVSVVWMNRAQNLSIISICKSPTWACVEVARTTFT